MNKLIEFWINMNIKTMLSIEDSGKFKFLKLILNKFGQNNKFNRKIKKRTKKKSKRNKLSNNQNSNIKKT